MATPYSEIYDLWSSMTSDYDSLQLSSDIQDEMLAGWLLIAINRFVKCRTDLNDRDDVFYQFNNDLEGEEKFILSRLMICEWLSPKLYSTENLKEHMTTKDWNQFSPANLLKEIRETHNKAENDAKNAISSYLHRHFDPKDLVNK